MTAVQDGGRALQVEGPGPPEEVVRGDDRLTVAPAGYSTRVATGERNLPGSDRAIAFSDAIFAITITLLVLEIKRPSFDAPGLVGRLLDGWSQYAAFAVSFVYIGSLWLNHHAVFVRVARVDVALNWINLMILGTTSLLPFSTGVLAGAFGHDAPAENRAGAVALYALVSAVMAVSWIPLFLYLGRHPDLLAEPERHDRVTAGAWRPALGAAGYAFAGLLGWFVTPYLGVAVFIILIVYHAITSEGLRASPLGRWWRAVAR